MRSWLFVPGDSLRKMEKAAASGADVLIFDLEDSVAEGGKTEARNTVTNGLARYRAAERQAEASAPPQSLPRVFVRINALDTPHWQDDLTTIIAARPDGIMLPKARSGADVTILAERISALEAEHGFPAGSTRLIVLTTELPGAVLQMPSFIDVDPRVEALTWGAEDLSAEIGAIATRDLSGCWSSPFQLARNLCLFAASASAVAAIDTVHVDFRNHDSLRREAETAARDGFAGKLAIHPGQVPIINAAFTPSRDDITEAKAVLNAITNADISGAEENTSSQGSIPVDSGVASLDGKMIDRPHVRRAERILARARAAGLM